MKIKMFAKAITAGLLITSVAYADSGAQQTASITTPNGNFFVSDIIPALQKGVNADDMQFCAKKAHKACDSFQRQSWEQYDGCVNKTFIAYPDKCGQMQAIYQKEGLLPNQVQAVGPITVFTLLHIGDGVESLHMIDNDGHIIDLATDKDADIKQNKAFQELLKKNPSAGVLPLVSAPMTQVPQVIMPKALANAKKDDVIQLVYPQLVNDPPCNACKTVAVAEIGYRFDRDGKFLGIDWTKTEAAPKI